MFGVKSLELIKDLKRCDTEGKGFLPHYNEKQLQKVFEEMKDLYELNRRDVADMQSDSEADLLLAVKMRHYGLIRNHRCVLAYLMARLKHIKSLRWGFGTLIPPEIRSNLSEAEMKWFERYNQLVFTYMTNATEDGIDLYNDQDPPKFRCVTVRCLTDYGDLILNDGSKVVLKKGLTHQLPRQECEQLIRQGVLEHILT